MAEPDNKGKRLLDILTNAKDSNLANRPALNGWGRVLGVIEAGRQGDSWNDDEETEIGRRLIQLRGLIEEVESQLKSIEGLELDLYLEPFPRIRQTTRLSQVSNSQFGGLMNQLTPSDLKILRFCSIELAKNYPESVADEQSVKDLLGQIESLFDEIQESDIPRELKLFLLKNLELMRRAIQEYRIRGIDRLEEALEQVAGSIVLHEELVKKSAKSDEMSRFSKVFFGLVSVVSFASKVGPLIGPAYHALQLLLPGDPNAVPPVNTH